MGNFQNKTTRNDQINEKIFGLTDLESYHCHSGDKGTNVAPLIICSLNIQGISNKYPLLEQFLLQKKYPEFVCLSEHWIPANYDFGLFNLENYTRVSMFCREHHIHGGTVIFVKSDISISCKDIEFLKKFNVEISFECCGVSFMGDTCVVSMYRSDKGDFELFENNFCELLGELSANFRNIYICGDLNIDETARSCPKTKSLNDILASFDLYSVIGSHTRIFTNCEGRTSRSSVDYIITNKANSNLINSSNFHASFSDHNTLMVIFRDERVSGHKHEITVTTTQKINSESWNEFNFLIRHIKIDYGIYDDIKSRVKI